MLNLLRFDGESGRASYGRYAEVAARSITSVGGALIYLGRIIGSDPWDSVALVYYPSPAAFRAMQSDPSYVEAIPNRTAGLRARLLYPFELPSMSATEATKLIPYSATDVVAIQLLAWNTPSVTPRNDDVDSSNPAMALRLQSVGSGLVTDVRWDELRLRRYESRASGPDDPALGLTANPDASRVAHFLSRPAGQP